jgi:hypothetical protein
MALRARVLSSGLRVWLCRRRVRRLCCAVFLNSLFGWLGRWASLRKRNVVVDLVVVGQVAFGDGVGAARFVLVDQVMHMAPHDVLGLLVHVQLVRVRPKDGRAESRTSAGRAADAHACEQLKSRNDSHCKAPAADGLATQPGPEKASERGIQERDDATDAGQALNTSETSTQEPRARSRPFCSLCTALCCRTGGTSGAGGSTL